MPLSRLSVGAHLLVTADGQDLITDGRADRQTDTTVDESGVMDGWVDGWMDGWVDEEYILTSTYRCRCDLKRLGC